MTKVKPTTTAGRPRMSPEARAKLSATLKAKFAAMTPEEQAAITGRLKRTPAKTNVQSGDKSMLADAARKGGRPNPLAMTPLELLRSMRGRTSSGDPDKR